MFTRCSNCRTVFHITAAELRAADGTVICGACGVTFDALDSLSEARPEEPSHLEPEPGKAATPPPAENAAESAAELDERARDEDEFLQELESLIGGEAFLEEPSPGEEPTGTGFPQMEFSRAPLRDEDLAADLSTAAETSEEFADEDEFLVEEFEAGDTPEESRFDQSLIVDAPDEPGAEAPAPEELPLPDLGEDDDLDDPFLDPDSVFRIDEEPEDGDSGGVFAWRDAGRAPRDTSAEGEAGPPAGDGSPDAPDAEAPDEQAPEQAAATPAPASGEAGEAAVEPLPEFARQARPGRRWPRVVTALLAVLLLAGTWAHSQRGKLLRHPAGEAVLGPVYRALGMEFAPDWNPADYRAVQWQAVADADRPDDLAVAVDFMNMAPYAQPYPIIRIVLEDRFGRRVGVHDVPPAEYLRDHSRGSRMAGGGRLQTTVVVRDPGGRADGFRVDFCLELEGRGLVCGPEPFR